MMLNRSGLKESNTTFHRYWPREVFILARIWLAEYIFSTVYFIFWRICLWYRRCTTSLSCTWSNGFSKSLKYICACYSIDFSVTCLMTKTVSVHDLRNLKPCFSSANDTRFLILFDIYFFRCVIKNFQEITECSFKKITAYKDQIITFSPFFALLFKVNEKKKFYRHFNYSVPIRNKIGDLEKRYY